MRKNGVHISKGARIAERVSFPHPISIVIGAGVNIESDVMIYQGVTLGLKNYNEYSPNKIDRNKYPTIKKGVIIYTNSVIVGGITIGEDSIVAANSFVSKDVPTDKVVAGNPAFIVSKKL